MIHSHYFISNKAGMPLEEFFTYWRKRHVRAVSDPVPQIRRYLQSHRTSELDGDSKFQGCAESWYDSVDDVLAMRNSPAYPKMLADERNFIDPGSAEFLLTEDRVIVDGERQPGMVKCMTLLKRKPDVTVADFRRWWVEEHAPAMAKFAPIRRYVLCPTINLAYAVAEPRWDGCAHIWLQDLASAQRFLKSEDYARMTSALRDCSVASNIFWAREHLVIWPK
jgi:uncharacterized protein (TIGR02118 family)